MAPFSSQWWQVLTDVPSLQINTSLLALEKQSYRDLGITVWGLEATNGIMRSSYRGAKKCSVLSIQRTENDLPHSPSVKAGRPLSPCIRVLLPLSLPLFLPRLSSVPPSIPSPIPSTLPTSPPSSRNPWRDIKLTPINECKWKANVLICQRNTNRYLFSWRL